MITVEANGARIPALGLGTWRLRDQNCTDMVEHALKIGYRHLDTAAMYENEEAVGAGLRASGISRDDVFITTKVWYPDCTEGALQRSAEASLKRLNVDKIDLLLIHWPNAATTLEDQVGALCSAKKNGLAENIGVSNFPSQMLRDAVAIADEPIVTNQVEYHPLLSQEAVLAACRETGGSLTSYCPIARAAIFENPVVTEIAAAVGKTASQVVLRWHVQQDQVIAIPRSTKAERVTENFDIFDFTLSAQQMAALHAMARTDGRMVDQPWAPEWD